MQGKIETRVGIFVLVALGIFAYMGFQVGAFRFDKGRYNPYTLYFKDISGLSRKAEVKIAGVKVGWIESLDLIPNDEMYVKANIMVLKDFALYENAHGIVRQEGLLGPKYLEIVPGDPLLAPIARGGALCEPSVGQVNMDELLHKFKRIASNVEEVTHSFKEAVGGPQGEQQLQSIVENFNNAAEKIASFADIMSRSFERNEHNIDTFLEIGENVRRVADKLESDVLPSFQESIEKISDVFDRDFNRVAEKLTETADTLQDASVQARDSFAHITSVTEKIDEGKGLVGKLINEDETYRDLKVTIGGLKNYFAKVNMIQIVFDAHGETMGRPSDFYRFEDSKFYFDVRIHPNEDNFYLFQLASSERGWRTETQVRRHFSDVCTDRPIDTDLISFDGDNGLLHTAFTANRTDLVISRNQYRIGLQFGKIYKDIAFRFGLFEGFGGVAVDFDIPFKCERFRWVTSFEAFDLTGWNRINDRRPHLKWLNKMFILRNIYCVFGADDFISRHNGNAFFGVGLRFGDDDIKYLLPSVSGAIT